MGFNREHIALVREEFRKKNIRAKDAATARLHELEDKIPGFREVERGFSEIGARVLGSAVDRTMSAEDRERFLAELEEKRTALSNERRRLLSENGYPADYTVPVYECKLCNDSGFVGVNMCDCMRKELVRMGYESSGIGGLIGTQSFDTFSLSYYREGEQRDNMSRILSACKEYAEGFEPQSAGNILFIGATGLGKTHLSTAIAAAVIEKGNYVVYESAHNIFSDFETERFGNKYSKGELSGKYLECDLLIIDDLGTEMATQFNLSCLYNLVNTRLNKRMPMIISSNITDPAEIGKRYTERLSSRFFGEFKVFNPVGTDIRSLKLLEK